MSCCPTSFWVANDRQFSDAVARRDLERYRTHGPDPTTRLLCDALLQAGNGRTVLDVGAGIGALGFELLAAGAERVTAVDAASAYLAVAEGEARQRGWSDRVAFVPGDFVTLAGALEPADIVTLDRVVCCYPAYQPLLEAAAGRCRRLLALSYPRDRWWVHAAVATENLARAAFQNPYRGFVHPAGKMEALLDHHGFTRLERRETWKWRADLYVRAR